MRYWFGVVVAVVWSAPVLAGVGKVSNLEGAASRTPSGQTAKVPLAEGAEVEVGDTLDVAAGGNLAVTLTDESVIALAENSSLRLDEARFGEQGSKVFAATLLLGTVWAKVTKLIAGSESKFEVTSERGIAGVRGTIFTVALAPGAGGDFDVGVEEGEVEVLHGVDEAGAAPRDGKGPRFMRKERLLAGTAVTVGLAKLARHKYAMKHPKMAAFLKRHRAGWFKPKVQRELRRELRDVRRRR